MHSKRLKNVHAEGVIQEKLSFGMRRNSEDQLIETVTAPMRYNHSTCQPDMNMRPSVSCHS